MTALLAAVVYLLAVLGVVAKLPRPIGLNVPTVNRFVQAPRPMDVDALTIWWSAGAAGTRERERGHSITWPCRARARQSRNIKSVGSIYGAGWGSGVMTLNDGTTHGFSFKGAKLLDIGASETKIAGTVYNLDRIEEIPGTFRGIGGGLAAVTAALGGVSVTNGKCVVMNGRAESAAALRLTSPVGPGGMLIELDD